MLKQITLYLLLFSSAFCTAQVTDLPNIEQTPDLDFFKFIEEDTSSLILLSTNEYITDSDLAQTPRHNLSNLLAYNKLEYSKIDGMPILKPAFKTDALPKYQYNSKTDYKILQKDIPKAPKANGNK